MFTYTILPKVRRIVYVNICFFTIYRLPKTLSATDRYNDIIQYHLTDL